MKAPYFVEILARNGDVLHRHKVAQLPIRIGRSYDNEIILDDAHSAASHAVVEMDEHNQIVLRDLGSKNGTVFKGRRHASVTLDGDTVVRLGHTRLRVRPYDFPVAPEIADTTMHGWEGATPATIGLVLIAVFSCLETWLSDVEPFALIRYLLVLASSLAAGLLWSGVWALANRLFGSHARLGRHLFILGSALATVGLWRAASSVLAYAWSIESLTRYGNLVTLAIACGMVFFHLLTIKPHHPRRFLITATVMLLAGSGLMVMANLQSTGRAADELYMSVLLPPEVRHSEERSVDQFMTNAGKLKTALDAARTESVKNGVPETDDDDEDGTTD
ncbi:FHA domain-containing protein [Duganella sp. CF402]|uniref:FHA domain-containing protein n=1 Tax=unclassified Duganella TaxID=2636909 RepID=UPI0008AF5F83|nr:MULTISPECIES: FHA domain-containing protein [unclassified Duganella]RZT09513.1 FHA domain protein [Duganella sp. BK701]SEL54470.1 FHA domain-containing protein [Duganella sp. CF402]